MAYPDHIQLFLPGPVEVRREVLGAQAGWMIGHRSPEFTALFTRLQPKLRQVFQTENRVYISTSSGTGLWEAASRCCVRPDRAILHLVNGAFGARWATVSRANGKQVDVVEAPLGQAVKPERVAQALRARPYDALAMVHNETSTGVLNPLPEIAEVARAYPETLLLVDAVSALAGAPVYTDAWGIDVCLTSSQKALALPPGLAFGAVSDRALARAEEVPNRGYYFDFLVMEKYRQRDFTPTTPPISLLFAAEVQLDAILAEGLEARIARHEQMAQTTRAWALEAGFELFAEEGYRSPTVTAVTNTLGIDFAALDAYLRARGMVISNGYGDLKDRTFRIAHMGDVTPARLQPLLDAISAFLAR
jgi:predicted phosphoserine aminotransferase